MLLVNSWIIKIGLETKELWPLESDPAAVEWGWTLETFNALGYVTPKDEIHGPLSPKAASTYAKVGNSLLQVPKLDGVKF